MYTVAPSSASMRPHAGPAITLAKSAMTYLARLRVRIRVRLRVRLRLRVGLRLRNRVRVRNTYGAERVEDAAEGRPLLRVRLPTHLG